MSLFFKIMLVIFKVFLSVFFSLLYLLHQTKKIMAITRAWLRPSRNTILPQPVEPMTPPSVKQLIPSLSSLNIPLVIDVTPETPPPQFAVESRKNKLKIGTRKNTIQKAYPSAFDTFLFDDSSPGKPNVGIKPVKLLIERLEAWYLISKRLLHHFEVLASVENQVAKNYQKLDYALIMPSSTTECDTYSLLNKKMLVHLYHRYTNSYKKQNYQDTHPSRRLLQIHFAYTEGFRGVCNAWESYHTNSVKDHSEFATFLRTEAIPVLTNIKRELKWMIDSIRTDDRLSLSNLTNLKAVAAKKLKCLDRQLVFFDENPYHGYNKQDPWLMNASVVKQMIKVYRHENKIHETVLRLQRETLVSEEQLVEEFRRLCQKIYKIREESALGVDQGLENIMRTFDNIKMDSDWHNFAQQHNEQLVSENAAFRHPDQLQYPNHSHALLQPIFAAHMERRSNLLHEWKENIYVLTPAGFLHEYKDNGRNYPSKPDNTLFIPHYKVSSLSTNLHHNLVFQLQPHASSRNMLHSQGHTTFIPKQWRSSKQRWGVVHDRWTWTLRAKSAADMELWVRYLTNTSERYGVCSFDYTNKYIPTIPEEAVKVVEEEVVEVKEEAVEIKEEAVEIKEEAVEIKEEAVEIKEEEVMKEEEVIKEEAVEAGDSTNEVVGAVKEEIIEEVVTKIDVTMDTAVIE